jgi:hypothetical protein
MLKLRYKITGGAPNWGKLLRFVVWGGVFVCICWVLWGQIGRRILRPIARRQISELTGSNVKIGSIDFRNDGVIYVRDLTVGSEEQQLWSDSILKARELEGRFSLLSILRFKPRLKRITVRDFVFNADYDADSSQWNLHSINLKKFSESRGEPPFIRAERGILRVGVSQEGETKTALIVGMDGSFSPVRGQKEAYAFYLVVDDRLGFGDSELRGIWRMGQDRHVVLNGRVLMGNSPVFGNRWSIKELAADFSYDSQKISINRFEFLIGDKTRVLLSGQVGDYAEGGNYDLRLDMSDIELSSTSKPESLVYSRSVLDRLGPKVRRFLEDYRPEGVGDICIEAKGNLSDLPSSRVNGLIVCKDVSILYEQFPYLMERMEGVLELTEEKIVFKELQCRHGEVDLTVGGYSGVGGQLGYDIRINSNNMLLNDDVYSALNEKQRRLWGTFSPSGLAKIEYRFIREQSGQTREYLRAELVNAKAVYQHFPYRLENLTGAVVIERDKLRFEDVSACYDDGRKITLEGVVTETTRERPRFDIVINAVGIPIDSRLKRALPVRQREFYEQFEVDAITDVKIKVFPNEVGRRLVEYIAEVNIRDASIVYEQFPLPLTEVEVNAVLTADVVRINRMTGRNGDDQVKISGTVWPCNDRNPDYGFCLSVEAQELELSDDFIEALPKEASKVVSRLGPRGKIKLSADLNINAQRSDCAPSKIVIECLDNKFKPMGSSSPIEGVSGRVTITDEGVELRDFRAGEIKLEPALSGALDGFFKQFYEAISPAGVADLRVDRARFFADSSGGKNLDFEGELVFKGCSFGGSVAATDLEGAISGQFCYRVGEGFLRAGADFKADSVKVKGRSMEDLCARIDYDEQDRVFRSTEFTADCYGGRVIGDIEIMLLPSSGMDYGLEMAFDGVGVREAVAAGDGSLEESVGKALGSADGSLNLSGTLGRWDSSTGRLSFDISDIEFAKRSFLGKVFTAVQLNEPTEFVFNNMVVRAYLKDGQMFFEQLYMLGESSVWQGRGWLNVETGQVDLELTSFGRKITSKPSFLESLAKSLGSEMVKVEVSGNIESPQVETTTFPMLSRPFGLLGMDL